MPRRQNRNEEPVGRVGEFVKTVVAILGEDDGDRQKRRFKEEVAAHAERMLEFRAAARVAGFTPSQVEFMAKFLALSDHGHQYYWSPHWAISSPPVDGRFEDRER